MEDLARRALLLKAQNADGGWGYFPGRESWLEPTAWAALALHGHEAADRAYKLVRAWQNADGSSGPSADVDSRHWTASMILTLAALRRDMPVVKRGLEYLLSTSGSESGALMRMMYFLSPKGRDRDPNFEGWAWCEGASAWIEPTVHGITALRLAGRLLPDDRRIQERIASAQNLIWHQRCRDGGWNYGARLAFDIPLQSFPETTALALIGLLGRDGLGGAIAAARKIGEGHQSPLSQAWLALSLRLHGQETDGGGGIAGDDIMLCAIGSLAGRDGNWPLLATGPAAASL